MKKLILMVTMISIMISCTKKSNPVTVPVLPNTVASDPRMTHKWLLKWYIVNTGGIHQITNDPVKCILDLQSTAYTGGSQGTGQYNTNNGLNCNPYIGTWKMANDSVLLLDNGQGYNIILVNKDSLILRGAYSFQCTCQYEYHLSFK